MSKRFLVAAVGVLLAVLIPVVTPGVARAHTEFESSAPSDGAAVPGPVNDISLTFSAAVTPTSDGFEVFDATGTIRRPDRVDTLDRATYVLRFDDGFDAGVVGVRWEVESSDGHTLDGSFAFTVEPPATTTTTTVAPTSVAPTTAAGGVPPATVTPTTAPATAATTTTVMDHTQHSGDEHEQAGHVAPGQGDALDDFLAGDDDGAGEAVGRMGRVLGFTGIAIGVGALALLAFVFRGTSDELVLVGWIVRLGGVLAIVGAALELVGLVAVDGGGVGDVAGTSAGTAVFLRAIGGVALLAGAGGRTEPVPFAAPRAVSAAIAEPPLAPTTGDRVRWFAAGTSAVALVGAAILLTSFWFDGHTVSTGPRVLHAAVTTVHVAAASVWVGGIVVIAALAWRHRRLPVELLVRFSPVASIALVAVALAGLVMAFFVLDSFDELTATPWGRTLLIKVGAVAVAAAIGAVNHFRLVPALETAPHDGSHDSNERVVRVVLTVEAAVLLFVVVLAAWLVAAAV